MFGEANVNTSFENRVWAAASAGWWAILCATPVHILSWLAYLAMTSARPAWFLSLWGQEVTWDYVQHVWIWALIILKMCVWLLVLLVLWLTLWARQLRKLNQCA
jgi:hypothetical protein